MAHSSWWRTPAGERFEFRQRLVSTWESLLVRGLVRGNSLRYFFSANPSRADLSGVDLSDGNLFSVSQDWAKAKLSGANLSGAKAPTVFFVEANLGGANLKAVWTNLIKQRPAAKLTIDRKFRSVFSHRSATRLKRLSLPTRCSMRARAL